MLPAEHEVVGLERRRALKHVPQVREGAEGENVESISRTTADLVGRRSGRGHGRFRWKARRAPEKRKRAWGCWKATKGAFRRCVFGRRSGRTTILQTTGFPV